MSLRDYNANIKLEYRSLIDNVVQDFYIPLLKEAKTYKRAVGFFSSTALVELSKGICSIAERGGHIQIVASPYLSEKDIIAIKNGYENRDKVIENALLMSLNDSSNDYYSLERLNLLASLISDGILDIRIAYTEDKHDIGMYHEKMGIIEDDEGNIIAYSGSMNESFTAMTINYESFDVFCNWREGNDPDRVQLKCNAFYSIWNDSEPNIKVREFPSISDALIEKYREKQPNFNIDEEEFKSITISKGNSNQLIHNYPIFPDSIKLHDYQNEAISSWVSNNYRGIFDMATGTGKTITGLGAITKCSNDLNNSLAVIIVAPYQHLVEQWVEDIEKFNIKPIIGYSASCQKDWKKRLEKQIQNQNILLGDKNNFLCFICTNATFSSQYVQKQIELIKAPKLLVVDEAHNFGSKNLSKKLFDFYEYRLALSATINRHGDDEGTKKLFDFFGEKCIEYDIERAINEKKLCEYRYYPIIVALNEDERVKYKQLTDEINKCVRIDKDGKFTLSAQGKILALQRASLIAGMSAKIPALKNEIVKYKNDSYILVYCGSAQQLKDDSDTSDKDESGERQIIAVSKLLGNEIGMKCHHFTSNENISVRKEITRQFSNGDLQCIVAIKCLDEGVNIPKIKTAFILASTTNPKEYIQRRGRVLRLAEGKSIAEIFDFIVIPYSIEEIHSLTENQIGCFSTLIKNELKRGYEFVRTAKFGSIAELELDKIKNAYNIKFDSITREDKIYELR